MYQLISLSKTVGVNKEVRGFPKCYQTNNLTITSPNNSHKSVAISIAKVISTINLFKQPKCSLKVNLLIQKFGDLLISDHSNQPTA